MIAVLLLIGAVSILCSCTKGAIRHSGRVDFSLEGYSVIHPNTNDGSVTATFRKQMIQFADLLEAVTGERVLAYTEAGARNTNGKEILVGLTGREESQEVYDSIKGNGFAICLKNEKLVIVGTTNLMTLYAVRYFCEQYLQNTASDGTLSLHKRVKANNLPVIELANTDTSYCSFVYASDLDDELGNKWIALEGPDYDYPYELLLNSVEKLKKVTDLGGKSFPRKTDEKASERGEIQFGIPDRAEVRECLSDMKAEEYGVFVRNERVAVTAWSDTALGEASLMFEDLIDEALLTDEEGKSRIIFPEGLSLTDICSSDWITDFPRPEGLPLYNTQDAGDNSLQYLYMGEGVNANAFSDYCALLESEGYALLSENEIEGSLFATYVNEERRVSLYVAYNAFSHAADNFNYEPRLKVISSSLDDVVLPDETILAPDPSYEKKQDSTITCLSLTQEAVGMGYVIMLEDGRFVLFDGGSETGGSSDRLWQILSNLHEKASGAAPSPQNPVRIAAWFLTHSHNDHYAAPKAFLTKYGKTGMLRMEYLFGNYPSMISVHNAFGKDSFLTNNASSLPSMVQGGGKFVRIHTGDKFYFANLEIEVLCTQEDLNPLRMEIFNDTSSIVRFTMRATDEEGNRVENREAVTTSVWTGDAFVYGSRFCSAMYGSYLESDMVQLAHHGNIGCESPFYAFIRPTTVWFPNNYEPFLSYTSGTNSRWQNKVDYELVYGIGSVKYVYTSDTCNATLTLKASGPAYEEIYDGITNQPLPYGGSTAIKIGK